MTPPIRIAQVVGNLETGGMQRMVIALLRGLDRSRYEPVLVHFKDPNHFAGEISERGWTCAKVPMRRHYPRRRLMDFARFLRKQRIDIVHAHSDYACMAGRMAALLAGGVRTIAHYQNTYHHRLTPLFVQREELLAPLTDMIISCSTGVDEFLKATFKLGDAPLRIVHNGIDPEPFRQASARRDDLRAAASIPAGTFHVVHTARLEPHKTPDLLLRALAHADEQLRPWLATFVGGGQISEELKSLAQELGIADRVRFPGWSTDIPSYLATADAYVLCSQNEGLPLALVEAMAAGVPVVASDIIGPREVVGDNEHGILIDPHGHASLAEALVRLQADPGLRQRLGEAGTLRCPSYTHDSYVRGVEACYEEVCATAPRGGDTPPSFLARQRLLWEFRSGHC